MNVFLRKNQGIFFATIIIVAWFVSLGILLNSNLDYLSPFTYLLILLQMHLYTGLFITAHDAMHGSVFKGNKGINAAIGTIAAILFAYNYYPRLLKKHHDHHRFVATDADPDYSRGNFLVWYFSFLRQYITIWQVLAMAGTYHLLMIFFPQFNVIAFWIVPSILSTLQLFYFGTYLPHRGNHDNDHFARSLPKNHAIAFLTCYFFGYHYEHHHAPGVPWWKLYKEKEKEVKAH